MPAARGLGSGRTICPQAVAMAEQLDAPVELSAALGVLSDVLSLRGLWREPRRFALRRMALSDDPGSATRRSGPRP